MASIHKEIVVRAAPDAVWDAVRDVGAIHTRLAREFVLDTRLEGDTRLVTFAGGTVVRERIVDVDDAARRLAYSVVDGKPTHHNASIQIFPEAGGSRIVWITDLLPNEIAGFIGGMMEKGCSAMKATLDSTAG
jgi:hypothetical protein